MFLALIPSQSDQLRLHLLGVESAKVSQFSAKVSEW